MKVLAMVTLGPTRFGRMPIFTSVIGHIHAQYASNGTKIRFKLTRLGDGTPLKTYEDRGEQ